MGLYNRHSITNLGIQYFTQEEKTTYYLYYADTDTDTRENTRKKDGSG